MSGTEASPCPSSGAAKFLPQQLRRSNSVDLPGETFLCQKRNFCIFGKAGRTIFYPFSLSPHPLYPGSLRPPFQPPAPPPTPGEQQVGGEQGSTHAGFETPPDFPEAPSPHRTRCRRATRPRSPAPPRSPAIPGPQVGRGSEAGKVEPQTTGGLTFRSIPPLSWAFPGDSESAR